MIGTNLFVIDSNEDRTGQQTATAALLKTHTRLVPWEPREDRSFCSPLTALGMCSFLIRQKSTRSEPVVKGR